MRRRGSLRQRGQRMGEWLQLSYVQRWVALSLRCVRQVTTRGANGLSSIIQLLSNTNENAEEQKQKCSIFL